VITEYEGLINEINHQLRVKNLTKEARQVKLAVLLYYEVGFDDMRLITFIYCMLYCLIFRC